MSHEQKNNSGVLFKNDRKDGEKDRDYQGTARVDGKDYWLSAWVNTSKNGNKYMSLSLKPKLESDRGSPPTGGKNDPRPAKDEFDDELPPF